MPKKPPFRSHQQKSQPQRTERMIIHDIGPQGDGIAYLPNRDPVYIERTLPEDDIETRIVKGKDQTLRGSIERVNKASPFRAKPPCPYYDQCGGCSMQHANDFFYKGFKQDIIHRAMKRVHVKTNYLDTVFCPPRTRRRATFAAFLQNKNVVMGYYKRRTNLITPIPDCLVLHPELVTWRNKIAPYLKDIIKEGRPVDVFLQMVDGQVEMVITGPIGKTGQPDLAVHEAVAQLVRDAGLARVGWRMKAFDEPQLLLEEKPLIARFGPLSVPLPLNAFLQPTKDGEQALVNGVMNALPKAIKHAVDLFSGCGTFSGPLLERSEKVDAFDIAGIEPLGKAAKHVPLRAAKRDLFTRPLDRDELKQYDAIVFDPPRAGAKEQVLEIARSGVPVVVGVSCNPATFARDAKTLVDGGYKLESLQIVDQFVWSHHVEVIGKFTR